VVFRVWLDHERQVLLDLYQPGEVHARCQQLRGSAQLVDAVVSRPRTDAGHKISQVCVNVGWRDLCRSREIALKPAVPLQEAEKSAVAVGKVVPAERGEVTCAPSRPKTRSRPASLRPCMLIRFGPFIDGKRPQSVATRPAERGVGTRGHAAGSSSSVIRSFTI